MTARDLLLQQFGIVYYMVARNVEGMTHEGSLARAAGGGNTANWILGHLVSVHNAIMGLVGAPPVWESDQLQRARFDHPIRSADDDAIDWSTLVERFNASRDACLAGIAALEDDALAETMTDPFGKPTTRGGMLALLAVHQVYHAGQLGMARRAAGLKGSILAPGQTMSL